MHIYEVIDAKEQKSKADKKTDFEKNATKLRSKERKLRVSDLLCMSNLAHASKLKEHDDNDDIQGSIRRAAERR